MNAAQIVITIIGILVPGCFALVVVWMTRRPATEGRGQLLSTITRLEFDLQMVRELKNYPSIIPPDISPEDRSG